jgi:hypothetical protein
MSVETQLARNLARIAGAKPDLFNACVEGTHTVRVVGPGRIAFYPIESWVSGFLRHLYRGFF